MSRIYQRLAYPTTCATCSGPVTLARRQDRYAARERGSAYCSRACSDRARAAHISAAKRRPRP